MLAWLSVWSEVQTCIWPTVSCFSKIQIGFTFLVLAHPGSPGQRTVKRVCVCACVHMCCLSAVSSRNLTWRDVQNIVVETSRIPNAEEDGWTVNGGGYHVNHRFGFGALDCGRMVEAAQGWIGVQEQHTCTVSPEHSQV